MSRFRLFCNPVDYSPPSFSVHGISPARILEWVAIPFSRGSFQLRDQTHISCISWSAILGHAFDWSYMADSFPGDTVVKNPPANAGDMRDVSSIPGLGRSAGEGNGNPLQYSCLENPMDRGTRKATVHGVTKNQT